MNWKELTSQHLVSQTEEKTVVLYREESEWTCIVRPTGGRERFYRLNTLDLQMAKDLAAIYSR